MNRKLLLTGFVLAFVLGSSAMAESYFTDTTGGSWSDPCNWSGGEEPNWIPVIIGDPPNSPDGAWVTVDTEVMDVNGLFLATTGTARLDLVDGGSLDVNGPWTAAIGPNSEATINVSGGYINGHGLFSFPSVWGVSGTVNYNQTGGTVDLLLGATGFNPGSVVNISVTGDGWLELGYLPEPNDGQLNIVIDDEAWVMLSDVNTATDTNITVNGKGRLTLAGGNRTADPTLSGILTSNGTIKTLFNTYMGFELTHFWAECVSPAAADLNEDCIVDLRDLALIVEGWLEDTTP